MTAPASGAPAQPWYLRPRVALPIVIAFLVIVALITPEVTENNGRAGDSRLTTSSASAQGAMLFWELSGKLGWRTERGTRPELPPGGAETILAVLAPVQSPTPAQIHTMLERTRAGGGLLVVLPGRSALGESLHVRPAFGGRLVVDSVAARAARCPSGNNGALPLWFDWTPQVYGLRFLGGRPADLTVFAARQRVDSTPSGRDSLAAVGFPLGGGRVVVVSDPDILRNDVLRVCRWGMDVAAVRMLEYLRDGGPAPRKRIVFDEYHQNFGEHPGSMRAIVLYLRGTRSGRMLGQLVVAALILLLAAGARTVPPLEERTPERRSPLEHVDALAHAYAQAGATRVATQRLVHGLRRRTARGARGASDRNDTEFLAAVAARHPALADDATTVRRALAERVSEHEFEAVGGAIRRLETTLSNSTS